MIDLSQHIAEITRIIIGWFDTHPLRIALPFLDAWSKYSIDYMKFVTAQTVMYVFSNMESSNLHLDNQLTAHQV